MRDSTISHLCRRNSLPALGLFVWFLLPAFVDAQSFRFRSYNVSDGLLQSTVNCITQDKEGYLWLATDGGISRYDGFQFLNFTPKDGLTESSIKAIRADREGRLWMGTSSGKIILREKEQFSEFKLPVSGEMPSRINHIAMCKNGDMWFATESGGAIKINFNKDTHRSKVDVYSYGQSLSDNVYFILPMNEKEVMFITDLGIKVLDTQEGKMHFFAQKILPVFNYTCAIPDKKGNLWLGTSDKGLCKFSPTSGQYVFYNTEKGLPGNLVNAVTEDDKGRIWASCWGEGVVCISDKNIQRYCVANGMPGNKAWSIFQDDEKNMWFGMMDKGICSFRSNLFTHYGLDQGMNNEIVNAILEDKNKTLWMATNEGICYMPLTENGKAGKMGVIDFWEYFDRKNTVTCITNGPGNRVYAGVFNAGIAVIDPRSHSIANSFGVKNNLINSIAFDNKGILWVGANNGLTLLTPEGDPDKTHTFNTDDFFDKQIVTVFKAQDGSMWLGTRGNGVYRIANNKINHYNAANGLRYANATSILQDENGQILVGTEGGGIYRFSNDSFVPYDHASKNYSDFITSLAINKNGMWIGTNNGISLTGKNKNYQFGKFEGFTEIEVRSNAVCTDHNGNIWVGTNNGACCLNFSEFRFNKVPPRLRLTTFKIFGDEFTYQPNKKFSYKQNEIVFSFRATSFTVPEKVQFNYRLESENYEDKDDSEYDS